MGHFRPHNLAPAVKDIIWSLDCDCWNDSHKVLQLNRLMLGLLSLVTYPVCDPTSNGITDVL